MEDVFDCKSSHFGDFELNFEGDYPIIVLLAKRNSGKSVRAAWIAKKMTHIQTWIVMTGSPKAFGVWSKILGSSATVYGKDTQDLDKVLEIIAFMGDLVKEYDYFEREFPACLNIGLICDDITCYPEVTRSSLLKIIFSNGRHYRIGVIITCQYYAQIPKELRENIDYLFLLHLRPNTVDTIYKELVDGLMSLNDFKQLHNLTVSQMSKKRDKKGKFISFYNALVFDNTICTSDPTKCLSVSRYEADFDKDKMTLGSEAVKQYYKKHQVDIEKEKIIKRLEKKARIDRLNKIKEQQTGNGLYSGLYEGDDLDSDVEERFIMNKKIRTGISIRKGYAKSHSKEDKGSTTSSQTPQQPVLNTVDLQNHRANDYPRTNNYAQPGYNHTQPPRTNGYSEPPRTNNYPQPGYNHTQPSYNYPQPPRTNEYNHTQPPRTNGYHYPQQFSPRSDDFPSDYGSKRETRSIYERHAHQKNVIVDPSRDTRYQPPKPVKAYSQYKDENNMKWFRND